MATIKLNVPEDLLRRLQSAASASHRDLSVEVVERLDESFGPCKVASPSAREELSKLARQIRGESRGDWLTPEFIRMAREWGRE